MVSCSRCGKPIEPAGDIANIAEKDLFYHLECAPDDLLEDAVTEGNAVLARGVNYFLGKYLPNEIRAEDWPRAKRALPKDEELKAAASLFALALLSYRRERAKRRKGSAAR